MKKLSALLLCLALLLGMLSLALPASAARTDSAALAAEVLRLTNAERAVRLRRSLRGTNAGLNAAAQKRAKEIASNLPSSFGHTRPDSRAWSTVSEEYPLGQWVFIGENVAYGQTTPERVVKAWMDSKGHKENILGSYTHMGVGVYQDSAGTYYWCQLFLNDGSYRGVLSFLRLLLRYLTFGWLFN